MPRPLHDLVTDEIEGRRELSLFEGVVSRTVSSTATKVRVIVPTFGEDGQEARRQHWGPMRWLQQVVEGNCGAVGCGGEAHIRYPQKGDYALVSVSAQGEPTLIGYWPPGD